MNAIAKRDFSIIGADIRKGDECKLKIVSTNEDNSVIMKIYKYGSAAFKMYVNDSHMQEDWSLIGHSKPSEK